MTRTTSVAARDRATVIGAALFHTVADAYGSGDVARLADAYAAFVEQLRDEFYDIARMARDEIRLPDE
jgi:hypothetical protein